MYVVCMGIDFTYCLYKEWDLFFIPYLFSLLFIQKILVSLASSVSFGLLLLYSLLVLRRTECRNVGNRILLTTNIAESCISCPARPSLNFNSIQWISRLLGPRIRPRFCPTVRSLPTGENIKKKNETISCHAFRNEMHT